MASPTSPQKKPRLSLQIRAISQDTTGRTSRTLAAVVNPKSPTSFNTLSNVYSTAIERVQTPVQSEPMSAIKTTAQPLLRLQTQDLAAKDRRGHTMTPYAAALPDTPLTAQPLSPAVVMDFKFPSTMTATPPLSAGPVDPAGPRIFCFSPTGGGPPSITPSSMITAASSHIPPPSPRHTKTQAPRRRTAMPAGMDAVLLPYTHTRKLHSILRNSPLPPRSAQSPISPRRQSLRLAEKAARRVGYNNPLTQTITTARYIKSHIDLLCEEASPYSPANPASEDPEIVLDLAMAYTGDETRDGGQTPGPFEEMRRRMAGLAAHSPIASPTSSGGIRKRKKKEKKRRWVWTIGQEEEEDERNMGGAMAALKAAEAAAALKPVAVTTPAPLPTVVPASAPTVPIIAAPRRPSRPAVVLSLNTAVSTPSSSLALSSLQPPTAVQDLPTAVQDLPTAIPHIEVVTPSIETFADHDADFSQASASSVSVVFDASGDVEMSETESLASELSSVPPDFDRGLTPVEMDLDTPTVLRRSPRRAGLGTEDLFDPRTGLRRDSPMPAELLRGV